MSRKPPEINAPDLKERTDTGLITQVHKYKLITPLFGGGVNPAEADPVTVVRGTEVRGHLRFWWRATRGGQFDENLAKMKEAEDRLWGAASTGENSRPSTVSVEIILDNRGQPDAPFEVVAGLDRRGIPRMRPRPRRNSAAPAYAAFPLQPTENEAMNGAPIKTVQVDVEFTLKITFCQKDQLEVEAALWAWETFGGIGARTRRGFGALCRLGPDGRPESPPQVDDVRQMLQRNLQKYVVTGNWPKDVPHLSQNVSFKVTRSASRPVTAWQDLIDSLKDFRQMRNPGTQANRPGRSLWPEPDAIRRLTKRRSRLHGNALSNIDKFPRAEFGLPIIFHFKDERDGDPVDTTLQGANNDRLASPLILRPLACANNQAVGLVLILEHPDLLPGGLVLKEGQKNHPVQSLDKTGPSNEVQAIKLLQGDPDVLRAFLNSL